MSPPSHDGVHEIGLQNNPLRRPLLRFVVDVEGRKISCRPFPIRRRISLIKLCANRVDRLSNYCATRPEVKYHACFWKVEMAHPAISHVHADMSAAPVLRQA